MIRAYRIRSNGQAGDCPSCGWPKDVGELAWENDWDAGFCSRACALRDAELHSDPSGTLLGTTEEATDVSR